MDMLEGRKRLRMTLNLWLGVHNMKLCIVMPDSILNWSKLFQRSRLIAWSYFVACPPLSRINFLHSCNVGEGMSLQQLPWPWILENKFKDSWMFSKDFVNPLHPLSTPTDFLYGTLVNGHTGQTSFQYQTTKYNLSFNG